ncbi:hypothetical protein GF352_00275 [archaeon]|nr:hypothetical protein [archaeon]
MKKVLMMVVSGIIITIITLSALLIVNRVTGDFQTTITQVTTETIENEMDVLLSGNSTLSEFKDMQETLRGLSERISSIFE